MRNAWLLVSMVFGASPCLGAEVYPSKPVRVIVTAAPGGVVDITARIISRQLSEQLGKQFIVEQRTGADGIIGVGFVAKSPPDGYTLLLGSPNFTILPGFNKSLPYDAAKDFTPITQIIGNTQVLVVPLSLKAHTLREFVALSQANPGKFNYGSGGPGSPLHLYSVLFSKAAKIDIVHIPYKGGGGDPILGMLAGEIQMLFAALPTALPKVKSGMVRALAVTTDGKRLPSMPDVPSMSEAGVPGMVVNAAYGFIGPAGMPKEVVNKLHAEVVRALAVPSVQAQYAAQEAELVGSSPEEYSELLRDELQRWDEVIKSAGITK